MLDKCDIKACILLQNINCWTEVLISPSVVSQHTYVRTTSIRHLHGLAYRGQSEAKVLTLIYYISFT